MVDSVPVPGRAYRMYSDPIGFEEIAEELRCSSIAYNALLAPPAVVYCCFIDLPDRNYLARRLKQSGRRIVF